MARGAGQRLSLTLGARFNAAIQMMDAAIHDVAIAATFSGYLNVRL